MSKSDFGLANAVIYKKSNYNIKIEAKEHQVKCACLVGKLIFAIHEEDKLAVLPVLKECFKSGIADYLVATAGMTNIAASMEDDAYVGGIDITFEWLNWGDGDITGDLVSKYFTRSWTVYADDSHGDILEFTLLHIEERCQRVLGRALAIRHPENSTDDDMKNLTTRHALGAASQSTSYATSQLNCRTLDMAHVLRVLDPE